MTSAVLEEKLTSLEQRIGALTANDPELRQVVREYAEVHERRHQATTAEVGDRLAVLGRIQAALTRLRQMPSAEAMIEAAPRHACESCDFDRAVLYRVSGSSLFAVSSWARDDPGAELEPERMQCQRPREVECLVDNRLRCQGLPGSCGSYSHVAAPIKPNGRITGFIHADRRFTPRRVDDFDRDSLYAFAEGFGLAVERAQLTDRLRARGQEVRRLLQRMEAVDAEFLNTEVELVVDTAKNAGAARAIRSILPAIENSITTDRVRREIATALTRREMEVLALLGAGASNSAIATRLCISDSTVKSHVKRIFRKLGATNRVEAATIWVAAQARRSASLDHALPTISYDVSTLSELLR